MIKYKSDEIIKKLYVSTIKPKLEYANTVWRLTSIKHIKMLELIQRRCTKQGFLSYLNYVDRLSTLQLTKLDVGRVRGEIIQVFIFFHGYDQINLVKSTLPLKYQYRGCP